MSDFIQFWQAYPKKVKKKEAERVFSKLKPDENLVKKMILALQAQAIYRAEAKRNGVFCAEPCDPTGWLKNGRWDDEIPSHHALKEKKSDKLCSHEGCSCEIHGPAFDLCTHHLSRQLFETSWERKCMAEEWKGNPELRSLKTRAQCVEFMKKHRIGG